MTITPVNTAQQAAEVAFTNFVRRFNKIENEILGLSVAAIDKLPECLAKLLNLTSKDRQTVFDEIRAVLAFVETPRPEQKVVDGVTLEAMEQYIQRIQNIVLPHSANYAQEVWDITVKALEELQEKKQEN